MKRCNKCGEVKSLDSFAKNKRNKDGKHRHCRECNAKYYQNNKEQSKLAVKKYRNTKREEFNSQTTLTADVARHVVTRLVAGAKWRAQQQGVDFNITANDVECPLECPMLGIRLLIASSSIGDASPTLDRLDPTKGYIPGNVHIISGKANRIKSNATTEEVGRVYEWMKNNL